MGTNALIELLQGHLDTVFVNEDGIEEPFRLMPPLAGSELIELEHSLPCLLPDEIREVLKFARGFEGVLDGIDFAGTSDTGFGLEEIFPHPVPLAADGYGNYWFVDLTSTSPSWGPIFFACHDAPVIVYQCDSVLHFVEECIRFGNKPWRSEIDDVHETFTNRIWNENPGVLSFAEALSAGDADLAAFAGSLDESWQFVDLRNARLGDGFFWGRYGWRTKSKRFGEKRIFAYQVRTRWQRVRDALT